MAFFQSNIYIIQDDVSRALIWYNISQMNKLSLIRVDDYVNFILVQLFREPLNFIVERMLEQLSDYLDNFVA
jgi:hypothetical protein